MQKLRGVPALAATLGAALVLAACGGGDGDGGGGDSGGGSEVEQGSPDYKGADGENYAAPEVPSGTEVVFTHDAPYTTYNNATADGNNFNNTLVLNQVIADAFQVDGNLEYLLNTDFLESAELTSEDPQVVTYKIKPDIQWSDGEAWDCDDFYLRWLSASGKAIQRDPAGQPVLDAEGNEQGYFTPASTTGFEQANAECTDDLTFVETYETPYADWRGNYTQNYMMPAHVVERESGVADILQVTPESPAADLQAVADFWNTGFNGFNLDIMPASGPYQLDSWEEGTSVTLTRNPNFPGNPGGPERIVTRAIADATAQAQGLENQEFTVIAPQADPVVADRLRNLSAQGIVFQAGGGVTFEHLDLQLANPLFQDKAVREAFAQCIDKNDLVDKLVRGVDPEAAPLGSLLRLPQQEGYQDVYADVMPADSEQSKQTLEAAGWALGPDGVYAKDGQRLSFRISHTDIPRRVQEVQLIQSHCQPAGFEIIDDTDPNFLDTRVSQGDYDVALFAWVGTPDKSSPAAIYETGGGQNWQGYTNPEVDAAWETVKTEFDEATRDEAVDEIDRLIAEDVVSLPLFQVANMVAYSDTIDSAYYQGSDGVTWNANEWEVQ